MVKKTIEIDINSDEAIKSIENLRKQLNALKGDIELDANSDKVKSSISEINTLLQGIDSSLELNADPNVAITQIDKIKTELDSLEGEIKIDGTDASKEIKKLREQVEKLNDEVVSANKKTEDSLKDVQDASNATAKGLRGIGTAIKAIGIGLLLEAFNFFKETIGENQKAVDFFATTFETLSLAFNDFINFVSDNFGTVTGFFKGIFEDPIGSIKDFGTAITEGIVNRVKQAIEVLGLLGKAAGQFFTGDFTGAMLTAKQAGKELFDVITGQEGGFEAVTNAVKNTVGAITNYTKSTLDAAKANVELNKQAEVARVLQQGLVETYDRQAEKLRQVRDDERNTIQERIKANNDLKAVLDEQEQAMLKQVDLQIASAQAAYDKNANQENYIALLEATQEREAVLAQIEGFRSEQLSNDMALMREQMELRRSMAEANEERVMSEKEFNAELLLDEVLRLEKLKEVYAEEAEVKEQRLLDDLARTKLGTQEQIDAQNAYFDFLEERRQQDITSTIELEQAKREQRQATLDNLITIAGAESKVGKALFLAKQAIALQEIISEARKTITFSQLAAARSTAAVAEGTAQTAKIGFPQNIPMLIGYAAQAVGIIGAIKAATSKSNDIASSFGASGSSFTPSTPSVQTTPPPTPPEFNTVGTSGVNQLAETIQEQETKPIKAYVVAGEVTTAQSLERNAVKEASI